MFVVVTLAAAIGAGIWWGMSTGLFKSAAEIDTSVPNPPATAEEEDFDPDEEPIATPVAAGHGGPARATGSASSRPTTRARQRAGGHRGGGHAGRHRRVHAHPLRASDAAVVFDVGQGVLEKLAGKRVVFAIVARAEEGKETQISISCNFGELGGCGRKRYAVGYERGDYLFEVTFPAKQAGAGGTIAINSDIANGGKALDIYEIRASVAQ